jgi:glycosyltransferase involved in cell wall biosynthesis
MQMSDSNPENASGASIAVSILMPTYNRAAYLGAAIESVQQQTYSAWELCIVDDGSTDDTSRILQRYASDRRIRLDAQPNSGQAAARNRALRGSSGRYVCFLDSDNLWLPGKLEQQVAIMESSPNVGVVYGETDMIDGMGRPLPPSRMQRYSGKITEPLLTENFVTFNTSMVRRELLDLVGGQDAKYRRAPDYDLWLRLSLLCDFHYEPVVWAQYRVMDDQMSTDRTGRFETIERMYRDFMAQHPDRVGPRVVRNTWCRFYTRRGRYLASVKRRREALADYLRAMTFRPFSRHPWRALARLLLRGG